MFSMVFPKTELFISLKKSFSKLFFAFILNCVFFSIYGFMKGPSRNKSTLQTFFNLIPRERYCFRFSPCKTIRFLSLKCCVNFGNPFKTKLSGARGKSHCEDHAIHLGIPNLFPKNNQHLLLQLFFPIR